MMAKDITEISESLFVVELYKDEIELNRPIQCGASILDHSK